MSAEGNISFLKWLIILHLWFVIKSPCPSWFYCFKIFLKAKVLSYCLHPGRAASHHHHPHHHSFDMALRLKGTVCPISQWWSVSSLQKMLSGSSLMSITEDATWQYGYWAFIFCPKRSTTRRITDVLSAKTEWRNMCRVSCVKSTQAQSKGL